MLSYNINLRKTGIMFLIFTLVFTGIGLSIGTPISYAASLEVYVSSGGDDTTGDGSQSNPYATLYKAYQEVNDGGTIFVLDNIDLSVNADKKYLHLDAIKSITISTASGVENTAVIQRGSARHAATNEGTDKDTLIYLEQGQLTLKNIIIDARGNEGSFTGRIMNVYNDSKLIIEEGAILRNSYSEYGGSAIYLKGTNPQKAVIEMRGGEITGNKHLSSAAVLIVDNADFIMSGGQISDNSGGGVDLSTNTNTRLVLSGTAQIMGNRGSNQPERNVILQGTTLLALDGNFAGKAGITAHNRMDVGGNFGQAATSGLAGLENLIADNNPHLYAAYGEGNALVWKLDKRALQAKVDEINGEALNESDYTAASWQALQNALADAMAVLNDPNATQQAVNDALTALVAARDGLVDKSALQAEVKLSEGLTASEYTEASWTAYQEKLTAAQDVLEKTDATQAEVDAALEALKTAREALVNTHELQAEVKLSEGLNETDYTEESWTAYQEKLTAAQAVLDKTDATQAEVDTALEELKQAREKLEKVTTPVVDKSELQKVVDLSEGLTESDYTPESWANLEFALTRANSVLENPNATQAEVDQALAELQKAMEDLVVLNGELEELNLVGLTNNGTRDIQLTPNFDPNQYNNYYGTVTNDVYGISLNPVAKHPDDTQVKIIVNDLEYTADQWNKLPLIEGENVITVDVYDKTGKLINEYTYIIVRERASGNDNSGGDNSGGGSTDGGNTGGTTIPSTPDNTVKPGNIVTTDNGSNVSFASGTVNGNQATVTIDKNKLSGILADGKGHKLGIRVPGNSDVEVRGLTLEDLKKLADTGSSLEIEDVLAIYPVPAGQLDVNAISKQFGNALISDIAANIKIKRSADDLAKLASEKAAEGGYELLVHPVDLDLTFNHDGKTDRAGLLNGYAPKYIALPEGIDPNRITTGVIVNPDGSVYHVPTVVTKVNNRYFALINDLRSSGTYSVIWNPQDFEDVQYHWGRADVNNIAARLDLKGNGDNTFSPNRHVTRSEFAEIVVLGLGLMRQDAPQNIYPDVPSTAWYRNAVALADEFDIVRGYTDGSFKGSQQITREQGFAMIARAYRLIQSENVPSPEQIASTLAPYADGDKVASWAKGDVAQLIAAGIIQGNGPDHLSPKAQMTRAEVTALIARMLKVANLIDK